MTRCTSPIFDEDGEDDWLDGSDDEDDDENAKEDDVDAEDLEEEMDQFEEDALEDRIDWISEDDRRAFKAFYDNLSPDQQRRYECFRRSKLNHFHIETIMKNVLDESNVRWDLDKRAIIVMAGLAKLFAGDIVESARRIMENRREKGGVCPRHLREAYRQLERMGRLPRPGRHKKLRR